MPESKFYEEMSVVAGEKIEDQKDLEALIAQAKKSKSGREVIEKMQSDFSTGMTELNDTVAQMREEIKSLTEERQLRDAENANLKTLFGNATEAEKKELYKAYSQEFGNAAAELSLFGTSMEKMLYGRLSKSSDKYQVATKLREVNDIAIALTGVAKKNGVNSKQNALVIDPAAFNEALGTLEKGDYHDEVSTYRKVAAGMDTQTANEGRDFIPTHLSQDYIEQFWLPLVVASMIERITMTSPTFEMPQITSQGRAWLMDEALVPADFTTDKTTPEGFTTDKMSFTARKLAASVYWSRELTDDAQIAMAKKILEHCKKSMQNAVEDFVINGNRTDWNTTLDNQEVTKLWNLQKDCRYLADGLRKAVDPAQYVDANETMNVQVLRAARKVMGKFGLFPSELAWVFGPSTLPDILNIDQVLRWRDIRDKATIMTGTLAEIDGIGMVFSEYIYNNLNADGVWDGSDEDHTIGLLFRPSGWKFGDRRLMMIENDYSVTSQQNVVVATARLDFQKERQNMEAPEAAIIHDLLS